MRALTGAFAALLTATIACNLPTIGETIVVTATPDANQPATDIEQPTTEQPVTTPTEPLGDGLLAPDAVDQSVQPEAIGGSTIFVTSAADGEPLDLVVYGGRGGIAPETVCFDSPPASTPQWVFEANSFAPGDRAEWCACGLNDPANAAVVLTRPNGGIGGPYVSRSSDSCVYVGAYNSDPFLADADPPLIGAGTLTISEAQQPVLESTYETVQPSSPVGDWTTGAVAWFAGFQPGEAVEVVYYSFNDSSPVIPLPEQIALQMLAQEAFRTTLGDQQMATADETGMILVETDIFEQQGGMIGAQGTLSTPAVVTCATVLGNDLDTGCGAATAEGDFPPFDDAGVVFGTGPKIVE